MQATLEATLAKLVSIPSVSNDPAACHEVLEYARSELAPLGLFFEGSTDTPQPWFYATTRQTKRPDILLAAHLDVVTAEPELFIMQKQGDKLFGRGVYDMKLAAACYIELFKAHADELRNLNIGILFTTDEEEQGKSMRDVLATGLRPKTVFLPDGGDNWHVEKRAKGIQCAVLTARGKAAHGSRPWEGENALHTLIDALQILRAKYPSTSPSDSTLAINMLSAGKAVNQIPDYASATIDFRSFSNDDLHNYRSFITELARTRGLEVTITATGPSLAFNTEASGVQSFLSALRSFTGNEEIAYCDSYGASDARYFAEYNIPCIIIEPHGGGRHADDEWLEAADLYKYYSLLAQWLVPEATMPVEIPVAKPVGAVLA